jgi:Arc/MetJ-type ribon-helix-helix transcriptional regulator
MKISVYLPQALKMRFDAYVKKNGLSTNRAIRNAVELLLNKEAEKKWGDWIDELESDTNFPDIKELRTGSNLPREDIF